MPRSSRVLKKGCCYLIRAKGQDNIQLFNDTQDYEKYFKLLKQFKKYLTVSLYGFCLFESKLYLIIHPLEPKILPMFMQRLNQAYAYYYNQKYKRRGKVWKGRYQSSVLLSRQELCSCIKMLEYLPVRQGLVKDEVYYPYSSCTYRILGEGQLVDREFDQVQKIKKVVIPTKVGIYGSRKQIPAFAGMTVYCHPHEGGDL